MEINQVVSKLIGPINAVGSSEEDAERLENLEAAIILTENLIRKIILAAADKERYESSMQRIGKRADLFITELKEMLT